MIEGLKVTIKGEELKTLCKNRAEHHRTRAKFYENQQKACLEAAEPEDPEYSNSSGNNPKVAMRNRAATHRASAGEMDFIAEHLDLAESYVLDRNDLHKIGICGDAF